MSKWPEGEVEGDLTDLFLKTTISISTFLNQLTMESYKNIWVHYGAIAGKLGFTNEDIIAAYIAKNEENYNRQKTGY